MSDFDRGFRVTCGVVAALVVAFVLIPAVACISCRLCYEVARDDGDPETSRLRRALGAPDPKPAKAPRRPRRAKAPRPTREPATADEPPAQAQDAPPEGFRPSPFGD